MKLSVIWILSDQAEENSRTYSFLQQEKIPEDFALQLLVFGGSGADTSFYAADADSEAADPSFSFDPAGAAGEAFAPSAVKRHQNTARDEFADVESDDEAARDETSENPDADEPLSAKESGGRSQKRRGMASETEGMPELFPVFSDSLQWEFIDHREDLSDLSSAQICNMLSGQITGEYMTVLEGGDVWSPGAFAELGLFLSKTVPCGIVMLQKMVSEEKSAPFSAGMNDAEQGKGIVNLDLDVFYSRYPYYLGGTILRTDLFCAEKTGEVPESESEHALLLSLCAKEGHVVYLQNCLYYGAHAKEGDSVYFPGIYQPQWYEESLEDFWIPFLMRMQKLYGSVPPFIQYHFMFSVKCRLNANWNNRNKHVIEDGEAVLGRIAKAFKYIGDDALFNARKISECIVPDSLKWVYGILKYGPDYRFQKLYHAGAPYYGASGILFNRINNLRTNLVFMDYLDGNLEIDATIHPILYSMADRIYFAYENERYAPVYNERYAPVYNERYAHTKTLGVSIYKSHSCHITIPVPAESEGVLYCFAVVDGERVRINFSYESHFSRMSPNFKNTYWQFGEKDQYFYMLKHFGGLQIMPCAKNAWKEREKILEREMRRTHKKRDRLFWCIRKAYFAVRPFFKKKPIWMYLDKIYKGGDSAEYLYKYASRQDNDFRHYYLIDKHSTDYKRLKKEGYKPLVRGSIKHRLVFLLADMMVISNSTVFAFNDFPMRNSRFVRDLTDFHVCCVQHGMSVQKIAVAQNRFRDNTRLYFCASKYEIENLSKPIYGYEGTDALKLTGVPRYDGLVDRAKKQIMISPTWRMQAAVPVASNQNEGQQRDYNPLFKESDYFRVYNALINDERLIGAAKEYGYRIKYVLHPIVSSQVEDFDQNDYVDIVPAVGDMSYEDMFCESALMVTDFSGIQFDFAYMRKPVVYLHHKDIPQHYEEGTFFYDTMGFGEICHDNDELIDLLIEYMRTGCHMKEEYVKRADDFFYYDDHDNCKRIYETMVEYQEEHILKNR